MPSHRALLAPKVAAALLVALLTAVAITACATDEIPPPDEDASSTSEGAALESTAAPTEPAAAGEQLDVVVEPPEDTIAILDPSAADAGSSYEIEFEVYGWGPEQGTLVIYVTGSEPVDDSGTVFDFAEENVVVVLGGGSLDAVRAGGSYAGTLVLVEREDVLLPELRDVVAR